MRIVRLFGVVLTILTAGLLLATRAGAQPPSKLTDHIIDSTGALTVSGRAATLTEEESDALPAAWTIPGAGRPLFEDAGANFSRHSPAKVDTHKADRGPLLLTSETEDHTVPLKVTKEVFGMYSHSKAQTDLHIFEGRGHSLTIDNGWKDIADVALQWLTANGL